MTEDSAAPDAAGAPEAAGGAGPRPWRPETVAVTAGRDESPGAPLNVPPTFASTFRDGETVRYGRWENPTWSALEEAIGSLEGGSAVAFSCGQAAVAAILATLAPGTTVVHPAESYLGTRQLLESEQARGLLRLCPVDVTDTAAVLEALDAAAGASGTGGGGGGGGGGGTCVWLESPTNPSLGIADLPVLLAAARERGAVTVVDNTFATPLLQRPLAWGASVVVHSATKYVGGHSDLLLGLAVTGESDPGAEGDRHAALLAHRTGHGAVPGVMEAFLALRGLRTLPVRIQRQQETAATLAARLEAHPAVKRVRYPGLASHPQHARARAQMDGFGAVLAFEVDGADRADRVVTSLRLAVPTTSLGGVETTIERRARWPGDAHVAAGLLRLSVGLEHAEDLWADLAAALDAAA